MKNFISLAVLLFVLPGVLAAQERGTITDSRTITERSGMPPDTTLAHTFTLGKKFRSEHLAGTRPGVMLGNDSATIEIMTFSDSGMTMDFLDPVSKTYTEFQPGGMMRGAMEMLKSMGSEMKSKISTDSASFDSLGDGGIVAGYRTIHFRTRFTSEMSMSMMGQSYSVRVSDTVDTYVAPALKDPADSSANKRTLEDMKRSLGGLMPFDFGDMVTRLSADATRIARAGVPLKTVNTIRTSSMGKETVQRMTTEALKYERAVLPDSLFQVPADYKKVDSMLMFRPDTTRSRTSRSPHKRS
jgi:hypothetical protein